MFHDRESNNKINKINESALRIIHKDNNSNFEKLLSKSDLVSVHQRNLQLLLTKIYKTVNYLNPIFMGEEFVAKDVQYNLRGYNSPVLPSVNNSLHGVNNVRFIGKSLW